MTHTARASGLLALLALTTGHGGEGVHSLKLCGTGLIRFNAGSPQAADEVRAAGRPKVSTIQARIQQEQSRIRGQAHAQMRARASEVENTNSVQAGIDGRAAKSKKDSLEAARIRQARDRKENAEAALLESTGKVRRNFTHEEARQLYEDRMYRLQRKLAFDASRAKIEREQLAISAARAKAAAEQQKKYAARSTDYEYEMRPWVWVGDLF